MILRMSSDPYTSLITLCDAYSAHHGITHWRTAFLVRGDGQFFDRLRKGAGCHAKTERKVMAWFSENWPEDLEWPSDIPRPVAADPKRGAA